MLHSYRKAFFLGADIFSLVIALFLYGIFDVSFDVPSLLLIFINYITIFLYILISYIFFFYVLDAYRVGDEESRDSIGRVLVATFLGSIVVTVTLYIFDYWCFSFFSFLMLFVLVSCMCLSWRCVYMWQMARFIQPLRIMLLGIDATDGQNVLMTKVLSHTHIVGYVGERSASHGNIPYLGTVAVTLNMVKMYNVAVIVIFPNAHLDDSSTHALLMAKLGGTAVMDIRSFYEHFAYFLPIVYINDQWLLLHNGFFLHTRTFVLCFKRIFDVCISLFLLLFTSPLMFLTALCIYCSSTGAVIYSQKRVGLHGKEFILYKFRSMHDNAEENGAVWADFHDVRRTRFGKILRTLRIDELPQLWNVLKGDMSFIGPRPERQAFVCTFEKSIPYYALRHTIKPGLTGWAQVCYSYGASEEDARHKLGYDLYYIKNMSVFLDIHIICKTVGVILFPKGVR